MTTKYTEKQIEDVARIIEDVWLFPDARDIISSLASDFADLFAADNPSTCIDCGASRAEPGPHGGECAGHLFTGGFDHNGFLAACGMRNEE